MSGPTPIRDPLTDHLITPHQHSSDRHFAGIRRSPRQGQRPAHPTPIPIVGRCPPITHDRPYSAGPN